MRTKTAHWMARETRHERRAEITTPRLHGNCGPVQAALVVFEVAIAVTIFGAVATVTLQANIVVVMLPEFLLLIPVYAGAFILVAHKPGGPGDAPADAGREEETRA